ncbi:MAG TPA: hypothetical protein PKW49_01195 [Paludibacteraceae bacterium]|nr:hypothetical protein [Paludibacteraceae bacterium]
MSYMLTTIDNPYDPFVEYDNWLDFDRSKGYYTNEYLARIAVTSPSLSDQEMSDAIEEAIDEIVELNVLGLYKKVSEKEITNADTGN